MTISDEDKAYEKEEWNYLQTINGFKDRDEKSVISKILQKFKFKKETPVERIRSMQNIEKILILHKEIKKANEELEEKTKAEKDSQDKIGELLVEYMSLALERDQGIDNYCVEVVEFCASCTMKVLQTVRKKNTEMEWVLNNLKTLMDKK